MKVGGRVTAGGNEKEFVSFWFCSFFLVLPLKRHPGPLSREDICGRGGTGGLQSVTLAGVWSGSAGPKLHGAEQREDGRYVGPRLPKPAWPSSEARRHSLHFV